MMRMIPPIIIDGSNLTSSTAVYLTDEWVVGDSYTTGESVHSTTTERVYYALQDSAGQNPALSPTDSSDNLYWQDIGPSNPRAMFDELNSTQTLATGTLDFVVTPSDRVDSISIFNITGATEVTITVTSVNGGGTIFDETYNMVTAEGPPMWDRIFGSLSEVNSVIADGFLAYSDNIITVSITGVNIGVGNVVMGQTFEIGEVGDGLTIMPRDYSLLEINDEGEPDYTPRASTFEVAGTARMAANNVDPFMTRLTNRKGPRAFIVSDYYTSANVFGVSTSFPVKLSIADEHQILTFKITGYI